MQRGLRDFLFGEIRVETEELELRCTMVQYFKSTTSQRRSTSCEFEVDHFELKWTTSKFEVDHFQA